MYSGMLVLCNVWVLVMIVGGMLLIVLLSLSGVVCGLCVCCMSVLIWL